MISYVASSSEGGIQENLRESKGGGSNPVRHDYCVGVEGRQEGGCVAVRGGEANLKGSGVFISPWQPTRSSFPPNVKAFPHNPAL